MQTNANALEAQILRRAAEMIRPKPSGASVKAQIRVGVAGIMKHAAGDRRVARPTPRILPARPPGQESLGDALARLDRVCGDLLKAELRAVFSKAGIDAEFLGDVEVEIERSVDRLHQQFATRLRETLR